MYYDGYINYDLINETYLSKSEKILYNVIRRVCRCPLLEWTRGFGGSDPLYVTHQYYDTRKGTSC